VKSSISLPAAGYDIMLANFRADDYLRQNHKYLLDDFVSRYLKSGAKISLQKALLMELEKPIISALLNELGADLNQSAKILGVTRGYLKTRMAFYGLL